MEVYRKPPAASPLLPKSSSSRTERNWPRKCQKSKSETKFWHLLEMRTSTLLSLDGCTNKSSHLASTCRSPLSHPASSFQPCITSPCKMGPMLLPRCRWSVPLQRTKGRESWGSSRRRHLRSDDRSWQLLCQSRQGPKDFSPLLCKHSQPRVLQTLLLDHMEGVGSCLWIIWGELYPPSCGLDDEDIRFPCRKYKMICQSK